MKIEHPSSKPQYDFLAGTALLIDKPKGWTSFDVVNKIRYKISHKLGVKRIKVGHAGTLDPMATGLLIICTGKFTKKISEFQGMDKSYEGTIKLGETTPSYDAETEVDQTFPIDHITPTLIEEKRHQFIGDLSQYPPMYSAIKVDGQPLYKKARKGIVVEVKPRPVSIHKFNVETSKLPLLDFEVDCSKGTYIRSLAFDMGKALDSGGHLVRLVRTSIGKYPLEAAWNIDDFINYVENEL